MEKREETKPCPLCGTMLPYNKWLKVVGVYDEQQKYRKQLESELSKAKEQSLKLKKEYKTVRQKEKEMKAQFTQKIQEERKKIKEISANFKAKERTLKSNLQQKFKIQQTKLQEKFEKEKRLALDQVKNEAIKMADDVNVGRPPTDVIPSLKRLFVILTSEFGSGKSLVAERLLQQAVFDVASSVTGVIPVYLKAQDISGRLNDHVQQISSGIGNPLVQGAFIIIDGADEAGIGTALQIINEARALVESWPNTRVFMRG